jgi:hypothetical protein
MTVEGTADSTLYPEFTRIILVCDGDHNGAKPTQAFANNYGFIHAWMMAIGAGWCDDAESGCRRIPLSIMPGSVMTHLHVRAHEVTDGTLIFEVWDGHQFIGAVYGIKDGRGIRVISKYALAAVLEESNNSYNVVRIDFSERTDRHGHRPSERIDDPC